MRTRLGENLDVDERVAMKGHVVEITLRDEVSGSTAQGAATSYRAAYWQALDLLGCPVTKARLLRMNVTETKSQ